MHYYMLFDNHTDAMAMYNSIKKEKLYAQIAPTPRQLSVCCGVSLLLHKEEIPRVEKIAKDGNLNYIEIKEHDNSFSGKRYIDV